MGRLMRGRLDDFRYFQFDAALGCDAGGRQGGGGSGKGWILGRLQLPVQ